MSKLVNVMAVNPKTIITAVVICLIIEYGCWNSWFLRFSSVLLTFI